MSMSSLTLNLKGGNMKILLLAITFTNCFLLNAADVKMDGVIFGSYNFYSSKYKNNGTISNNYNTFDIGRIYLSANTKHSENYNSKITLEANTLSNGNNVFLKLAFLNYVSDDKKISISFGLVPSIWIGDEEGVWRNVFVEYTQMHLNKIITPSDKGVSLKYSISRSNYFQAMISNGEGFKNLENSKTKNLELKFANSYKNLFSAFYYSSNIGDKEKQRYAFLLSYAYKDFSIGGSFFDYIDYSTFTVKGNGFSIYSHLKLSESLIPFIRWDHFDKNKVKSGDIIDYYIGGVKKILIEDVYAAISYKYLVPQKETSSNKKESIIQSSIYVKF